MNVLNRRFEHELPLLLILTSLELKTRVHVTVDGHDTIFIAKIERPTDVYSLCRRIYNKVGYHPCVYEIGTYNGFETGIALKTW